MQVSGLDLDAPGAVDPKTDTDADTWTGRIVRGGDRVSGPDLGTPMGRMDPADTAVRDARFTLREDLRDVTTLERLRKCGASVLAGGVTPVLRRGRAGYAGVVTCGSVHVCPCCGASIRAARQDSLEIAGVEWECHKCGLAMMTLTMRHYERQTLAELCDYQRTAWREAFGQNAKRGWRNAKRAYGIRGFVRAWETTHTAKGGWHVHYHVLIFFDRPLDPDQVERLTEICFRAWYDALLAIPGAYAPNEKYGVRIDAPDRGESGQLARYLMKQQDGKARWGIASEMTRQDLKKGRKDGRTPMEIAMAAVDPAADPEQRARDLALWQEFEAAASGIRSLYWSNGLKALLASMDIEVDARPDGQLAEDDAAEGERLACIPAATWYEHIVQHKGRALALLRAAERDGTKGIRALVESWGLAWGADVLEVEELAPEGPTLTAAEVLRRAHRVEMAARAKVWRQGFAAAEKAEVRARALEALEAAKTAGPPPEPEPDIEAAAREAAELADAAAGQVEFLSRHRAGRAGRAAATAAALGRLRNPDRAHTPTVSLRKSRQARPVPAPTLTPPPPAAASLTCRGCQQRLPALLIPYGRHYLC